MVKRYAFSTLITLVLGFIYFYFALPVIHWKSSSFWSFLLFLGIVFLVSFLVFSGKWKKWRTEGGGKTVHVENVNLNNAKEKIKSIRSKKVKTIFILIGLVLLTLLVLFLASRKLFRADAYSSQMTVTSSEFSEDIAEIPLSQIPVVDKDTAERLGSRKLGEVVELVSQFNVTELYTQINYRNSPTRVSPLEYADVIKWFNNQGEGIPYYVMIDMATQETELVQLEQGMRYSPSEHFNRNLMRHIRFHYPTKMTDEISFEINDDGNPFWVVPYYDYDIGFIGGKDIHGIILVDAVTGELTDYPVNEIPSWIDRVYPADLVVEQANNWGTLSGGYWNSMFGQKGVLETTDGYNYIALNDDVWLYTGITSVVADESNIGFIMVNMRTKETRLYSVNGAEEYSAMDSARGKVQEKGYTATFPILINVADRPTYFISLKDNAGLVKAYAFVDVQSYQNVAVGDTIAEARDAYIKMIAGSGEVSSDTLDRVSGTVEYISSAVKEGNTYYYLQLEGDDRIFIAAISVSDRLPIIKTGDTLTMLCIAGEDEFWSVNELK